MTTLNSAKIAVGILSFAHYHANFWSEVFKAGNVLVGIWDDDHERGREAAQRFDVPFFQNINDLFKRCTAVAICSQTNQHRQLIEKSARLGLAVLSEKPLSVSMSEGLKIKKCIDRYGTIFMQSFPKRFDPVSHYLKKLIDEKTLGKISLVRIRHGHFYGLDPEFCKRWYVQPDFSGGGALLDEGVHGADLLAWIFGLPQSVIGLISHEALGLGVEDLGIAIYKFSSGMVAELTASFSFAAADTSIEIYGSEGTVLVSAVDLASKEITSSGFVRLYQKSNSIREWQVIPITPQFKLGEFHHQNAHAFLKCLRENLKPPITIDDGLRAQLMVATAYRSAKTGKRIAITQ